MIRFKKFSSLDNQSKKMFMKKYLDDPEKLAQRLKNQETDAGYYLTARIKHFLVKKFIKLMLARKNKMNAVSSLSIIIKDMYIWISINQRLKPK